MSTVTRRATLDDLMRFDGPAELINGEVAELMASGHTPNVVAGNIYFHLRVYLTGGGGGGVVYHDGMGFVAPELPSGRDSFSPDAAYYTGPRPANRMRFADGPPDFAVEVRGENDHGPAAERSMADKRADYFAAGTLVVWDVDPVGRVIRCHRATAPDAFAPGQDADAEPAVPGRRVPAFRVLGE